MEGDRRHNDEAIIAELRGLRELFTTKVDNLYTMAARIEAQTVKTNGRVSVIEKEVEILKIINADEEGQRKAMKPFWVMITSITVSLLAAIGIDYIKR